MKAPHFQPIPTPPAQRLRHARATLLPWAVFLCAFGAVAFLWKEHVAAPTLVAQAEGMSANVSSHKPGVLAGMRVARFQKVHAGEPLASVLVADPKLVEASLAVIRSELDMLRSNLQPIIAQQRNAVDYAKLRLDWMRQRADLAGSRANVQAAEAEFHRTEELFNQKIASPNQLDIARAKFHSLQDEVTELAKLVADSEQNFTNLQAGGGMDIMKISDEPIRAAVALQDAKLRQMEAELNPVLLSAPMDGTVTAVFFRSGESVTAGQPIVTIAADTATRIVGYLHQPIRFEPKAGATVQVRARGGRRETGTAQILDVGAHLDLIPPVLQSPLKPMIGEMGLPVNISLPNSLNLRPGELVDVRIVQNSQ